MAYHVVVPFHHARRPCGEACVCRYGVSTLPVSGRPYDRWGVDLTCVRSAVRPLTPPILASDQLPALGRPRRRVSCPRARGRGGQVNICHTFFSPPREDLLEVSDLGADDEVRAEARELEWAGADPTEQKLGNLNDAGAREFEWRKRADPTEQELKNLNGARADPTEQELGNLNGVGADPIKQELENLNSAGADPTEQELRNLNGARADPTEHELRNLNGAGADPTEQELENLNLGFCREGELGHKSWDLAEKVSTNLGDLAERVNSGSNPMIWSRRWTRAQILGFGREGELEHKSWGFGREGELGHKS
ncbi:hypothetical protein GW17_00015122 [Ensete ventricosum]|nr:hypothetical protein GW17_00015122 [Ensete ventricosum]